MRWNSYCDWKWTIDKKKKKKPATFYTEKRLIEKAYFEEEFFMNSKKASVSKYSSCIVLGFILCLIWSWLRCKLRAKSLKYFLDFAFIPYVQSCPYDWNFCSVKCSKILANISKIRYLLSLSFSSTTNCYFFGVFILLFFHCLFLCYFYPHQFSSLPLLSVLFYLLMLTWCST